MNLICHWGEKNTVDQGGERRVSQKSLTWKLSLNRQNVGLRLFSDHWCFLDQQKAKLGAFGGTRPLRADLEGLGTIPCARTWVDWVGMTDCLVLTLSLFLSCPGAKYIRFGRTQALLYPAEAAPLSLESELMAVKLGTVNDSFMLHRFSWKLIKWSRGIETYSCLFRRQSHNVPTDTLCTKALGKHFKFTFSYTEGFVLQNVKKG